MPSISPGPGTLAFDSTSSPPAPSFNKDLPLEFNPDLKQSRGFNLSVSGQYEGSTQSDIAGLAAAAPPALTWQLPDADAALAAPNYAGSNKVSLRAGLAVPVLHGLTLNLNYDAQRSSGRLHLARPRESRRGEQLVYRRAHLHDSVLIEHPLGLRVPKPVRAERAPLNGYTQTGEDVNFTVKF